MNFQFLLYRLIMISNEPIIMNESVSGSRYSTVQTAEVSVVDGLLRVRITHPNVRETVHEG